MTVAVPLPATLFGGNYMKAKTLISKIAKAGYSVSHSHGNDVCDWFRFNALGRTYSFLVGKNENAHLGVLAFARLSGNREDTTYYESATAMLKNANII